MIFVIVFVASSFKYPPMLDNSRAGSTPVMMTIKIKMVVVVVVEGVAVAVVVVVAIIIVYLVLTIAISFRSWIQI